MTTKQKISFILAMVIGVVCAAWRTLNNFFGGVGVNFVAVLVMLAIVIYLFVTDSRVRTRFKDLLIFAIVLVSFEFVNYLVFEFAWISGNAVKVFAIIQSIVSLAGLAYLIYTMFRFFIELKGAKYKFVENMLGNNPPKKDKKSKELINGSLEEKPNQLSQDEDDEELVEVDTEEE